MDTLHQLATLLPLALTSGFNLYLTVLVAGLCIRYGVITGAPHSLTVWARVKGIVAKVEENDVLPSSHMALLGHRAPEASGECKAGKLPGAAGRSGFLTYRGQVLSFTFDKWWKSRLFSVEQTAIKAAYVRRRILVDVLDVHHADAKGRPRVARFVFLKDRAVLMNRIAHLVGAQPAK